MSAFTYSLKGRDRKLASLYAERRVCPWGSSKSYSFQKKYKGALWRFWFTVLSFGIFGYEPKKFLKWGKLINIALEMVFAGGGEARRVRIQDASILTLSSWCFNFLFFFFFPESLSSGTVSSLTNYESRLPSYFCEKFVFFDQMLPIAAKCSVFISEKIFINLDFS